MSVNVNPDTGIRFGIIANNNLNDWVYEEIIQTGTDIFWEEAEADLRESLNAEGFAGDELEEEFEHRLESLSDNWYCDEPIHAFDIDGVKGHTTYLGGALMIWVFESPHTTTAKLCSPCVPNCGDLDNLDSNGEVCYDVPPEWRINHKEK